MPLSLRQMVNPSEITPKYPKLEEVINIPQFWIEVELGHGEFNGETFKTAKYTCLDEQGHRVVYSTSAGQPVAFAEHVHNLIVSGEAKMPIMEWIVAKRQEAKSGRMVTIIEWADEQSPREESKHQADLPF